MWKHKLLNHTQRKILQCCNKLYWITSVSGEYKVSYCSEVINTNSQHILELGLQLTCFKDTGKKDRYLTWNYRLINFQHVLRVRTSETHIHTQPHCPSTPLSSSLKVTGAGNTRPRVPRSVCALEHVCSGESVPAALDASNTQRYSLENHYSEVTAETSPSASASGPLGQFTLSVSHTL